VAVAEELHFGHAAERLHLSQPSLSDAIRRLEASLGIRLFERDSRHVALTPAGEAFLARARVILGEVEAATAAAREIHSGEAGPLRIGHSPGARAIYAPVVGSFSETYPEVAISAREMLTTELIDDLRDRRVDVAFTVLGNRLDGLVFHPIKQLPLAAVVASNSPYAARRSVALAELREERLLLPDRELAPQFTDHLVQLCRDGGFEPTVGQLRQPWDFPQIAAGEGFGIVPEDYLANWHALDGVSFTLLEGPAAVPLDLTWRKEDASAAATSFVKFVLEAVSPGS
jgi:DNA-binding transcriptional LysR family regulator